MAIALAHRFSAYASFIKLEHTIFSLPLIFAGTLLGARGWPAGRVLGLILLAAAGGRVMAMGLNRIIDTRIDARNPRTAAQKVVLKLYPVGSGLDRVRPINPIRRRARRVGWAAENPFPSTGSVVVEADRENGVRPPQDDTCHGDAHDHSTRSAPAVFNLGSS